MQKKLLAASFLLFLGAGCTSTATVDVTPATDTTDTTPTEDTQGTVTNTGADDTVDGTAEVKTGVEADTTVDVNVTIDANADVAVQMFTVTGSNFAFSPNTMTVKQGDVVQVTFKNGDGFHDFVIDELGVNSGRIKDGEEATVTFTASKVGSFEYYCSVGEHRAMGMVGTLTVTE